MLRAKKHIMLMPARPGVVTWCNYKTITYKPQLSCLALIGARTSINSPLWVAVLDRIFSATDLHVQKP